MSLTAGSVRFVPARLTTRERLRLIEIAATTSDLDIKQAAKHLLADDTRAVEQGDAA